ncbi:MAG: translation initiation factor IF-2, partial [Candidatus Anstonellales archaeon]
MDIRSPIITVLGHVDHGKTSLLDAIRGSRVAAKESGGITQMIGASLVTKERIIELSKDLKDRFKFELVIPGLLFIDTPGHEVFTNLRYRGGAIADMAIVVIDIKQGVQPQTIESINVLKDNKTPFVIAANKIDLITSWHNTGETSFIKALEKQKEITKQELDNLIYTLIGQLSYEGFDAERVDRINDFTKQLCLLPISARTKEGIAELLLIVSGLSQKYLKDRLYVKSKDVKGSVMEIKEEKGIGTTLDCIIHDGIVEEGQELYFLTKNGVIKRKIKAILMPNVSSNYAKEKYRRVERVVAAAGIKILASDIEDVLPGSPVFSNYSEEIVEIEKMLKKFIFESEQDGIVVKADSLGSIEALYNLLNKNNIKIAKLDIGPVNKDDIIFASSMAKKNRMLGIIINFNLPLSKNIEEEARNNDVRIISSDIIYKIPEVFFEVQKQIKDELEKEIGTKAPRPCIIKALKGFFFRISKPAIFGVEVVEGTLKVGTTLMDEKGNIIGQVKSIQQEKTSLKEALKGSKVAISVEEAVLGKDVF